MGGFSPPHHNQPLTDAYGLPIHTQSPPPQHDPYGIPPPPPPPPPILSTYPPPPPSLSPVQNNPRVHYGDLHEDLNDGGDMPLLRRDNGGRPSVSFPMPGGYNDDEAMAETNIRYGRIPQRVPRRYKTIKKVE